MHIRFLIPFVLSMVCMPSMAVNLYQDETYRALAADRRGQRIGDAITVLVVENSSAAASAGAQTDKSNAVTGTQKVPKTQNSYAFGFSENFDGNGSISRSGRLLAQLSVTVIGIEPNGDLRIKGDQNLEINGEKQAITLEGRVRPTDVSETNTVLSSRITDAKITYIGDGILAESQRKGWFSRVLSFLGLI